MRYYVIALASVVLLAATPLYADDAQDKAAQDVEKLGGRISRTQSQGEDAAAGLDQGQNVGEKLPVELLRFSRCHGLLGPRAGAFAGSAGHVRVRPLLAS